MTTTIALIRRDENELSPTERAALTAQFGNNLSFHRIDPVNCRHHVEICERLNPAAILLQEPLSLFSGALSDGYPHLVLNSNSPMKLSKLKSAHYVFEDEK